MSYVKYSGCRICQHPEHKVLSDIDVKLLDGVSIEEVVDLYAGFFTDADKPLNYFSLQRHKSHLKKQVATNLMGLPPVTENKPVSEIIINENGQISGLESYVALLNKNKETLDSLIASATEDLMKSDEFLAKATGNAKNQALLLTVKNNIRDSIRDTATKILELITPSLNNVSQKDNAQVLELLLIVKKSATLSIKDILVRDGFMKELALQIGSSRELKWMNDKKA